MQANVFSRDNVSVVVSSQVQNAEQNPQLAAGNLPLTIGIFGGGQLGMMLAQSALRLGFRCVFLEDAPNCPARLYGKVYSSHQLEDFVAAADVFTLEFENTPVETLRWVQGLDGHFGVFPPPLALEYAQDRLKEKNLFTQLGIETVPFLAVENETQLQQACQQLGLPLVLKTSRGGYDGKGQFVIQQADQIAQAWQTLGKAVHEGATPAPLIAEAFIPFTREISIIATRGQTGEIRCYHPAENHHHQGILATTHAPAPNIQHLETQAQNAVKTLMQTLNYVGTLALEFFVSQDQNGNEILLANEFAPRVHNSGHWSIEAAITSQFENHIRAITGLPLGDTDNLQPSIMINVISQAPKIADILAIEGAHYHSYHKSERPNRKIAHITLIPKDQSTLNEKLQTTLAHLPNPFDLLKKD